MTRYFPEVVEAVLANLPPRCVVDGEIVVVGAAGDRLDFEALQQRIHPAASRVSMLARADAGALRGVRPAGARRRRPHGRPFAERRAALERGAGRRRGAGPRHAGHGATSTVAAATGSPVRGRGARRGGRQAARRHLPARQADHGKIKHERTADCVRRGLPAAQERARRGRVAAARAVRRRRHARLGRRHRRAFPMARRRKRALRRAAAAGRRLRRPPLGLGAQEGARTPRAAEGSRWNAGKDLSFVPLRPRARGRGPLRPHGGRPLPAHRRSSGAGAPTATPRRAPTSSSRSRCASTSPMSSPAARRPPMRRLPDGPSGNRRLGYYRAGCSRPWVTRNLRRVFTRCRLYDVVRAFATRSSA